MEPKSLDVVEFAEVAHEPESERDGTRPARASVRWRELAALLLIVVLADVTIYRGEGFAGAALFVAGTAALLVLGAWRGESDRSLAWVLPLLAVLAAKLVWNGSELGVVIGALLLIATAMSIAGQRPFVLEGLLFASQTIPAGLIAFCRYAESLRPQRSQRTQWSLAAIILPVGMVSVFAVLFVLANPDLLSWISQGWSDAVRRFRRWLVEYGPSPPEVAFWCGCAWLAAGMLRPLTGFGVAADDEAQRTTEPALRLEPAPLYSAYRNTLVGLVVLFALYLAFEFATLWFREFPPGFYYSGYAHEGAAWLTVALGLATLTLSIVFQGRMLRDPRLATLRRWAGAWVIQNLVLAVAVVHRMLIYIDFNGMTRMRVVGLLGISAVVAGLLLVVFKISRSRSIVWLVRRDLWALGLCFYLYAVVPVDVLVTWYNVLRIQGGDPAPSVQISVHPLRDEGWLLLRPLLNSDDPLIREGVRAMLAERLAEFDESSRARQAASWTAWQMAEEQLQNQLHMLRDDLAPYEDTQARKAARQEFDEYAYQWY